MLAIPFPISLDLDVTSESAAFTGFGVITGSSYTLTSALVGRRDLLLGAYSCKG